jgi:hypothetical protein
MASRDYEITVSGDISHEELDAVSTILRERESHVRLKAGDVMDRASVFTTPEMLVTASAIAAVLQLLLEAWNAFRKNKVLKSQDMKPVLEERLKKPGCEGIEVSEVRIQVPGKARIVLQDIPEQTRIEIQAQSDSTVTIIKKRLHMERR